MKLSLAWIFDHIHQSTDYKPFNATAVERLLELLGARTVEVEGFERLEFDKQRFTIATVIKAKGDAWVLMSPELNKEIMLAVRPGCSAKGLYVLVKDGTQYRYATLADFNSEKEGLFPEVFCLQDEIHGAWKEKVDAVDYLITIDNKAITHRPDLWGHRGFAREIAALLGKSLKAEEEISISVPIKHFAKKAPATKEFPYELTIDGKVCRRLAGVCITDLTIPASTPWAAIRLARIGIRPCNAVVDATNYVMIDYSQPMHAFDMQSIEGTVISARLAGDKEKIILLDGQSLTLGKEDCVIADMHKPLALAGIMGGLESGISLTTQGVFVEAANFDAHYIRQSSMRHHCRTEASARFEKSLDPNQNTQALLRFLYLLRDMHVSYQQPQHIISLGELAVEPQISLTHHYITERLGVHLVSDQIVAQLTKLGFGVTVKVERDETTYIITVPTFRSTRDVLLKEDLLEEIIRMVGYDTISAQLPSRLAKPTQHTLSLKTRMVKQHCVGALSCFEVQNYAFYDESFVRKLPFMFDGAVLVKNPVSENWRRLVTSLVSHMIKNVADNLSMREGLRFFEINSVWRMLSEKDMSEHKQLAFMFFSYKKQFDFYEGKVALQSLFDLLHMHVVWNKVEHVAAWYLPEQTAQLQHNNQIIGYAGKLSPQGLSGIAEGDAFIAELDMEYLLKYTPEVVHYEAPSKYPKVDLDISLLVPVQLTVDAIKVAIANADERITTVQLRDFFEKGEWKEQRSVTIRFTICDTRKTLVKEEIDEVYDNVIVAVKFVGAHVR